MSETFTNLITSPLDQFQILLFNPWGENLSLGVTDLGGFFMLLEIGAFEFLYYLILLPLGFISDQFEIIWSLMNSIFSDDMTILAGLTTVTGSIVSEPSVLGVFPEVFLSSFTVALLLTFLCMMSFTFFATYKSTLVPNRWQSLLEMYYSFMLSMCCEHLGTKNGEKYFNSIFAMHLFVLWANVLALFPYTWSVTSQLMVTMTLSFMVWMTMNIVAFLHHGVHFLSLFAPAGSPPALAPAIVVIEVAGYFVRLISLGVRLFANILGGHTLMKIICVFIWFVFSLGGFAWLTTSFALGAVVIINGLELAVAFIQAYVFSLLTTIFLSDALEPSH